MSRLNFAGVLGTIHRSLRPGISTRRQAGLYVTTVTVQMSQSLRVECTQRCSTVGDEPIALTFRCIFLSWVYFGAGVGVGVKSLVLLNVARYSSTNCCHDR